jgi:methionine aminopeptidase type II
MSIEKNNKLIVLGEWKRNMRSENDIRNVDNNKWKESNVVFDYSGKNSIKKNVLETDTPTFIYDIRRAAEVHKIVRKNIQSYIKPGVKILDVANKIENDIVKIFGQNDLKAGIAFPPGLSINNVIAHDTANSNDTRIIGYDDICKIDYGTHVNGYIIDCAFSAAFNPEYENLLNASKEATWAGIRMSGPDASIYDISKEIKEVIESHECTIKGKTYPIVPIKDLGGHNIKKYEIHAGQLILSAPYENKQYKESRMNANEFYAIETFASTGSGKMGKSSSLQSNHYMLNKEVTTPYKGKLNTFNTVYWWIKKNRSTLPFCPRWIEKENIKGVTMSLNEFARKSHPPHVIELPPLVEEVPTSYVSHFEHTIYLHDHGKEVLSAGDDY